MNAGLNSILNCFLADYVPAENFNPQTDRILSTEDIISELSDMAQWDMNEVAAHIDEAGFFFTSGTPYHPHGWILRTEKY